VTTIRLLEHPAPFRGEARTATGRVTRRLKSCVDVLASDGLIVTCLLATGLPRGGRGVWRVHPDDLAPLLELPEGEHKGRRYEPSTAGVKWEGV
jgi:hypothetical protein